MMSEKSSRECTPKIHSVFRRSGEASRCGRRECRGGVSRNPRVGGCDWSARRGCFRSPAWSNAFLSACDVSSSMTVLQFGLHQVRADRLTFRLTGGGKIDKIHESRTIKLSKSCTVKPVDVIDHPPKPPWHRFILNLFLGSYISNPSAGLDVVRRCFNWRSA